MKALTVDRIAELLELVRDVRVLVVGDLMLDRYISGRVSRISPEAPVPRTMSAGRCFPWTRD